MQSGNYLKTTPNTSQAPYTFTLSSVTKPTTSDSQPVVFNCTSLILRHIQPKTGLTLYTRSISVDLGMATRIAMIWYRLESARLFMKEAPKVGKIAFFHSLIKKVDEKFTELVATVRPGQCSPKYVYHLEEVEHKLRIIDVLIKTYYTTT